ncbi:hypothetical protein [Leptolyngbya sp. FACHB-16]|nr:hypothetical protein [Leptolyngbya sp. FACHB-16]MBD1910892.1 hypothetical protein [Leptolyngbya sp. FACHB-8]MBD2153713.1 hypothetical protein [Leptolyngbya sp. FACHB-16]
MPIGGAIAPSVPLRHKPPSKSVGAGFAVNRQRSQGLPIKPALTQEIPL